MLPNETIKHGPNLLLRFTASPIYFSAQSSYPTQAVQSLWVETKSKTKELNSGSGDMNRCLTTEAVEQLQEGINLVLFRWTALRMAVENGWGGRDPPKVQDLSNNLFLLLTQSKEQVYIDDVEKMLDDFMLDHFKTEVEDGSVEEVAEKLMIMHEECSDGKFESIKRLKERTSPVVSYARLPGSNGSDEDDVEDEDEDGNDSLTEDAICAMEVDDTPCQSIAQGAPEGWTVVSSKRNRGRKD